VKPMLSLFEKVTVKSVCHVTGGGFYENIPRSLKDGLSAKIALDDVRVLPIFKLIERVGKIPQRDMFNTFNMGVGMIACVAKEDAELAIETLKAAGEDAYILGELVESDEGVILY
ncbi:MAG: phosphoribosylformylglycinamidine cyclo-ligase, partial [Oscillospiraceae bacterium]|nr:phosphoribosylformylglycinamidine cyclo-ligase [Oscillospiraceae bacterium]